MNKFLQDFLATATFLAGARADKMPKADPKHRVPSTDPIHDLEDIEHGGGEKKAYDATEAGQRLVKAQSDFASLDEEHANLSKKYGDGELTPDQRSELEYMHTARTSKHHEIEALKKQIEENDFGGRTERDTPDHPMAEHFVNHSGTDDEEEMLKHKAREHLKGLQQEAFAAEQALMEAGASQEEAEAEVAAAAGGEGGGEGGTDESSENPKDSPEKISDNPKPEKKDAGKDETDGKDKPDQKGKSDQSEKGAKPEGKDAKPKGKDAKDGKDTEGKDAEGDNPDGEGEGEEDHEGTIKKFREFMQFIVKRFPDVLEKFENQDLHGEATKKQQQKENAERMAEEGERVGAEQAAAGEAASQAAKDEKDGDRKFESGEKQKDRDHQIKLEKIKQSGKKRSDRANPLADSEGTTNARGLKEAAGILFVSRHGKVLIGLRAENGAYQRHWGIFGGHREEGESLEVAAIREVMEEAGYVVTDPKRLQLIATTDDGETEFTYFVYTVDEPFIPRLNNEHTEYMWLPFGKLPMDCQLIPGFEDVLNSPKISAIRRAKMTELDVIRAMRQGFLPSPQVFYNMTLYKMRITGTGVSFRHGTAHEPEKAGRPDEYVMREPDAFLHEDFVERCNGIPLIFDHPEKALLNSKEWRDRVVGIMVMPWIEGNDVWGIAKVYDDDTKTILNSKKMSTSPSVVFLDRDSTSTIALNDGSQILVERVPTLLDHLAICDVGVWDKGGDPTGVESRTVVV